MVKTTTRAPSMTAVLPRSLVRFAGGGSITRGLGAAAPARRESGAGAGVLQQATETTLDTRDAYETPMRRPLGAHWTPIGRLLDAYLTPMIYEGIVHNAVYNMFTKFSCVFEKTISLVNHRCQIGVK